MKPKRPTPSILLPLAVACATASYLASYTAASEYLETNDFGDVADVVADYSDRFGAPNTLLVIDIDNTLLTMQGDLGSDSWFEWQEYLLSQEPDSPDLVAKDFAGLLDAQGLLFKLGKMHPPQPNLPVLVKQIQSIGVPTLVLTSRGPAFRAATERELEAAGYDFTSTVIETEPYPSDEFLPYNPEDFAASGLSAEDIGAYRLGKPRPVSMANGVFMSAGQHKGAMLATVLNKAKQQPAAVVFVDDHGRHVHRVANALSKRGIEATVLHYKLLDDRVQRFRYSDKTELTQRWRRLDAALKDVFALPGEEPAAPHSDPVAADSH